MNARGLMELIIVNIGLQKRGHSARSFLDLGHVGNCNHADDVAFVRADLQEKGFDPSDSDTALAIA
jgi:hypothetical protein